MPKEPIHTGERNPLSVGREALLADIENQLSGDCSAEDIVCVIDRHRCPCGPARLERSKDAVGRMQRELEALRAGKPKGANGGAEGGASASAGTHPAFVSLLKEQRSEAREAAEQWESDFAALAAKLGVDLGGGASLEDAFEAAEKACAASGTVLDLEGELEDQKDAYDSLQGDLDAAERAAAVIAGELRGEIETLRQANAILQQKHAREIAKLGPGASGPPRFVVAHGEAPPSYDTFEAAELAAEKSAHERPGDMFMVLTPLASVRVVQRAEWTGLRPLPGASEDISE